MQTDETRQLFTRLETTFGGHHKAANALGISNRTYYDWRKRGFKSAKKWKPAILLMYDVLKKAPDTPAYSSSCVSSSPVIDNQEHNAAPRQSVYPESRVSGARG